MLNIFVMTLGEIEFGDNFVQQRLGPFQADVYALLFVFLFLMPIVLMNLMVSLKQTPSKCHLVALAVARQ